MKLCDLNDEMLIHVIFDEWKTSKKRVQNHLSIQLKKKQKHFLPIEIDNNDRKIVISVAGSVWLHANIYK